MTNIPFNEENIIGETLAALRKNKGFTQKEFSKLFNVSEGTIAHYEQGITVPNAEMLFQFACYFEVPVDYLIGKSLCKIEYTKLNATLYRDITLADMVNIVSSFSASKRNYLYQTLLLLKK